MSVACVHSSSKNTGISIMRVARCSSAASPTSSSISRSWSTIARGSTTSGSMRIMYAALAGQMSITPSTSSAARCRVMACARALTPTLIASSSWTTIHSSPPNV